jgi:hypothetical protein
VLQIWHSLCFRLLPDAGVFLSLVSSAIKLFSPYPPAKSNSLSSSVLLDLPCNNLKLTCLLVKLKRCDLAMPSVLLNLQPYLVCCYLSGLAGFPHRTGLFCHSDLERPVVLTWRYNAPSGPPTLPAQDSAPRGPQRILSGAVRVTDFARHPLHRDGQSKRHGQPRLLRRPWPHARQPKTSGDPMKSLIGP